MRLGIAQSAPLPCPHLRRVPPLLPLQARLGRDLSGGAQRWGPRPIDLDIVFYEDQTVTEGDTLVVPHPRWQERGFVQAPLADLCAAPASSAGGGWAAAAPAAGSVHAAVSDEESHGEAEAEAGMQPGRGLQRQLALAARLWQAAGGERQLGTPDLECVLPMGRLGLWPWQRRTQVGVVVGGVGWGSGDWAGREQQAARDVQPAQPQLSHLCLCRSWAS